MLLILVSFLAKWGWRSERQTTELGGKDWFFNNSSPTAESFLDSQTWQIVHDPLEGDIWRGQSYCARERETRPESAAMVSTLCHLWWNCSDGDDKGVDVGCDNEGAFEDDCDIPGTLTALSLTGLRWRRQRGDIRRLRIISLPRRDEIGWMKIDNIHVSFRWRSWAQTTWPCRPCWTSSPQRTLSLRPPGSSTALPQ